MMWHLHGTSVVRYGMTLFGIPILGSNGSFPRNGIFISVANCSAPPVVAGNISDVF